MFQVIFGFGLGYGGYLTLASYNRFQNNYVLDTMILVIVHLLVRIACAVIVMAFVGFLAFTQGVPINEVGIDTLETHTRILRGVGRC